MPLRGRNLTGAILDNPFDEEIKSIALAFSDLLKRIVETIDRRGFKTRFLRKHSSDVLNFQTDPKVVDFSVEPVTSE